MRNITDEKFGRLTAICVHHSANHRRFWLCNCDCGKQAIIRQDQLTTGKTKSCGCLEMERRNRPHIKREYVSVKINGHNRKTKEKAPRQNDEGQGHSDGANIESGRTNYDRAYDSTEMEKYQ